MARNGENDPNGAGKTAGEGGVKCEPEGWQCDGTKAGIVPLSKNDAESEISKLSRERHEWGVRKIQIILLCDRNFTVTTSYRLKG